MKLLLDENLPHRLRHELHGHDARTVAYMRWTGLKNGQLLAAAAAEGFDAVITLDEGIEHQQDVSRLPIAVVILHANSNAMEDLQPIVPGLLSALRSLSARRVTHVR